MSSEYNVICMSHDPVIVGQEDLETWGVALDVSTLTHPHCDLLVGRWSGTLVELGCPGMPTDSSTAAGKAHSGWHRDIVWADAGLLRVAATVVTLAVSGGPLDRALRYLPMCWTPARLTLLAPILLGDGS